MIFTSRRCFVKMNFKNTSAIFCFMAFIVSFCYKTIEAYNYALPYENERFISLGTIAFLWVLFWLALWVILFVIKKEWRDNRFWIAWIPASVFLVVIGQGGRANATASLFHASIFIVGSIITFVLWFKDRFFQTTPDPNKSE